MTRMLFDVVYVLLLTPFAWEWDWLCGFAVWIMNYGIIDLGFCYRLHSSEFTNDECVEIFM